MQASIGQIVSRLMEGDDLPNDLSETQIEDVVSEIYRQFEGKEGLDKLISPKGLNSEAGSPFQRLALDQLERCTRSESGVSFLTSDTNMFDHFIRPLFDEADISGAEIVARIIRQFCKNFPTQATNFLFTNTTGSKYPDVLEHQLENSNEVIRIRLLDLFASISNLSNEWFEIMNNKGFVSKIFQELDNDDLLTRLSAFQLLGKVCSSEKGMEYMSNHGTPEKLAGMLDLSAEGFNGIILSNAITLIGELASRNDRSFDIMVKTQPKVLKLLQEHLEHDNDEVVQSVIFCLARSCSTPAGLEYLLSEQFKILMRDWLEYAHSSNAEMKGTTFYSLSIIFDRDTPTDLTGEALEKHESNLNLLYSKLGLSADYPAIEVLHKNLNGSLIELKYAALTLLKSMMKHKWGVQELVRYPGLPEWFINRASENTKRGHELKFDVLQAAVMHPDAKQCLGLNNYHLFLEYVKLGVYYQRGQHATLVKDQHA